MAAVLKAMQEHRDEIGGNRCLCVIHNDLPSNHWAELFNTVNAPAGYAAEGPPTAMAFASGKTMVRNGEGQATRAAFIECVLCVVCSTSVRRPTRVFTWWSPSTRSTGMSLCVPLQCMTPMCII